MKYITLTRGARAIVDSSDYAMVNAYKWTYKPGRDERDSGYARHNFVLQCGGIHSVTMGQFLMQAPMGMVVDHINGNGLDNRRMNLRVCTHQENMLNRRVNKNSRSGYKGVQWSEQKQSWQVAVAKGEGGKRKVYYGGAFKNPVEAAKAYDKLAVKIQGEFARLNFPGEMKAA
ncbi:MAG TPA: HNH endonuclease [Thermoanaerobaculia bacterium]|jgi:hypothetical protein|nr:HNH endonuclease [Thermoanaerobaculia bacterium]